MENAADGRPSTAPSDYVADTAFDDLGLSEPLAPRHRRARLHEAHAGAGGDVPARARRQGRHRPLEDRHRQDRRLRHAAAGADPRRPPQAVGARHVPDARARHPGGRRARRPREAPGTCRSSTIYGGASMERPGRRARGGRARSSSARPGRIYDHIRRRTLKLDDAMVVLPRRGRRDAQHGLLRGGHPHPRPPPRGPPAAALLGHGARRHRAAHPAVPHEPGDAPALRRRVHGRAHPPHPLRRRWTRTRSRATSSTCSRWRSRRRRSSSATRATTPRSSPRCSTATASTRSCSTATCRRRSASG